MSDFHHEEKHGYMATGYEMFEDGTSCETEVTKDVLTSDKVFCIVDDTTQSIYLWKGKDCGVRKRFVGAREASNLRSEYGFKFRVKPLDEGEEPPSFLNSLE